MTPRTARPRHVKVLVWGISMRPSTRSELNPHPYSLFPPLTHPIPTIHFPFYIPPFPNMVTTRPLLTSSREHASATTTSAPKPAWAKTSATTGVTTTRHSVAAEAVTTRATPTSTGARSRSRGPPPRSPPPPSSSRPTPLRRRSRRRSRSRRRRGIPPCRA